MSKNQAWVLYMLIILIQVTLNFQTSAQCDGTPNDIIISDNKILIVVAEDIITAKPKLRNGLPSFESRARNDVVALFPPKSFQILAAREAGTSGRKIYHILFKSKQDIQICESQAHCYKGSDYSEGNQLIVDITATTAYGEDKLQIANFFVDEYSVEWQEASNRVVIGVEVEPLQNGEPRNPTAIGCLGKVNGINTTGVQQFVIFFDEIFTVQAFDIEERFLLNQPLVVSRSHDYQLAKTWLKCPTELCFDSRLDYAYQDGGVIVFGRGEYFWKIHFKTKRVGNSNVGNVTDDVLTVNGDLLAIQGNKVLRVAINETRKFSDIFYGAAFEDVDAAFELNGEYVLLNGNEAQIFKLVHSGSEFPLFKFHRTLPLGELFPPAPSSGFDAAANLDGNRLYLFNNNFYYEYHPSTGLSTPKLIQGNLIYCRNIYYKTSSASKKLNISNYQDFVTYRTQFIEKSSVSASPQTMETMQSTTEAKTVSMTTLTKTTVSRPKLTKNRSSRKSLQIAALGLLTSIAIFVSLLLIAVRLHLKALASFNSADNDTVSHDEPLIQSVR
ncbi:hypothetical protein HDE_13197 [Halotydeus destructor]|nr:hypothetical protein HDE_13197 [Halotydeus destructor]